MSPNLSSLNLLTQAALTDVGNWSLCLMSAWMVVKVEAPAKANMMEAKALKVPSKVAEG